MIQLMLGSEGRFQRLLGIELIDSMEATNMINIGRGQFLHVNICCFMKMLFTFSGVKRNLSRLNMCVFLPEDFSKWKATNDTHICWTRMRGPCLFGFLIRGFKQHLLARLR